MFTPKVLLRDMSEVRPTQNVIGLPLQLTLYLRSLTCGLNSRRNSPHYLNSCFSISLSWVGGRIEGSVC